MTTSDFVWSFPCFVLARDYRIEPGSDRVLLDADTQVLAPELTGDGEQHIAIFTDVDLAERFREQSPSSEQMHPLKFAAPVNLKSFLETVQTRFRYAAIDLNPHSRVCRSFLISELLTALDQWIRELDG